MGIILIINQGLIMKITKMMTFFILILLFFVSNNFFSSFLYSQTTEVKLQPELNVGAAYQTFKIGDRDNKGINLNLTLNYHNQFLYYGLEFSNSSIFADNVENNGYQNILHFGGFTGLQFGNTSDYHIRFEVASGAASLSILDENKKNINNPGSYIRASYITGYRDFEVVLSGSTYASPKISFNSFSIGIRYSFY